MENRKEEIERKTKLITIGNQAPIVRTIKKKDMQFPAVRTALDKEIREKNKDCPDGVDALMYKIIKESYEIATTSHKEGVQNVFCSCCGKPFKIICGHCGKPNSVNVDSASLLKAKVPVINKLLDKLAPNLQSSSIDIKFDIVLEKLSTLFITVLNHEITDISVRKKYLNELEDTVGELVSHIDKQRINSI